jgi:hypothetical protein
VYLAGYISGWVGDCIIQSNQEEPDLFDLITGDDDPLVKQKVGGWVDRVGSRSHCHVSSIYLPTHRTQGAHGPEHALRGCLGGLFGLIDCLEGGGWMGGWGDEGTGKKERRRGPLKTLCG